MKPCESAENAQTIFHISAAKLAFIKKIFIMKNLTDFRKTVEAGMDLRLYHSPPPPPTEHNPRSVYKGKQRLGPFQQRWLSTANISVAFMKQLEFATPATDWWRHNFNNISKSNYIVTNLLLL